MSLIKIAIKNERWDLAAHVIVLAAVKTVNGEVKKNGKERKTQKGRSAGE